MHPELYIDGCWHEAAAKERFDVVNPATEETLASVASAELADADVALDAAQAAFPEWASRPPRQRSETLRKIFELGRVDEFSSDDVFLRFPCGIGHDS